MKIVAIGGGNLRLGDDAKPYNLDKINEEIVKLANKKCSRLLLYIGFNIHADYYFSQIKTIFMEKGCQCSYLNFRELSNIKTVESKLKRADIIFLPGGNTLEYMKKVRKFKIDKYLLEAAQRGAVLAGIWACPAGEWYRYGLPYKGAPDKPHVLQSLQRSQSGCISTAHGRLQAGISPSAEQDSCHKRKSALP